MRKHLYQLAALLSMALPTLAQKQAMITPIAIMATGPEYSKEVSLHKCKEFVMNEILGKTQQPILFEVDALSAATSGELTSLVYICPEKQKEGLLFAFWGNQWNAAGVRYQAYGFKDFPKAKANELLTKVETVLNTAGKSIKGSDDNVYFQYDDLTFLVYEAGGMKMMRVFWGDFDSEWNIGSFNRTKRRLEKKI